jgi:hypothetical protein
MKRFIYKLLICHQSSLLYKICAHIPTRYLYSFCMGIRFCFPCSSWPIPEKELETMVMDNSHFLTMDGLNTKTKCGNVFDGDTCHLIHFLL